MHLLPPRPLNPINSNYRIKEKLEPFGKIISCSKRKHIEKKLQVFFLSFLDKLMAQMVSLRKDTPIPHTHPKHKTPGCLLSLSSDSGSFVGSIYSNYPFGLLQGF